MRLRQLGEQRRILQRLRRCDEAAIFVQGEPRADIVAPPLVGGKIGASDRRLGSLGAGVWIALQGAQEGREEHQRADEGRDRIAGKAEDARVAGAIKTDFILSAEIMTISLAAITVDNFWTRAAILALVGVGITALVYGTVAVLVKADDFGVLLARKGRLDLTRKLGRWLVRTMPVLMRVLTIVGTAAMIWVGGGIILHGLASFGLVAPEHWIDAAAEYASHALPFMSGFAGWAATAFIEGLFGLAFGLLMVPVAGFVIAPIWRTVKSLLPKRA